MILHAWATAWHIPPEALTDLVTRLTVACDPGCHAPPETEAGVQARARLAAQQSGGILWRNNSGAVVDSTRRMVRFGLCNDSAKINAVLKSSDLIGIGPGGRFVARECKRPGWKYAGTERELAQLAFLTLVESLGGDGRFVS